MGKGNKGKGVDPSMEQLGQLQSMLAKAQLGGGGGEEGADEEDDDDEEEEEPQSTQVMRRVLVLRNEQMKQDKIRAEYLVERIALEKKYEALYQAGYAERKRIVNGAGEPPVLTKEEEETLPPDTVASETDEGIENFWLNVLGGVEEIACHIQEEDMPLLGHITDITTSYDEDYKAFTLTFHFSDNDFIENSTLQKTYKVEPSLLADDSPDLTDVQQTAIIWKDGKDLTMREIKKKLKAKSGKHKGQTRTVSKLVPKASFFHYFSEPKDIDDDDDDDDADKEDEEDPIGFDTETDYDIGHALRVSVIPEAIFWYTGENGAEDDSEDEDDKEEEEDGDEDGESDNSEESDEGEEALKGKGNGNQSGSSIQGDAQTGFAMHSDPGVTSADKPPECKQG